MTLPRPRSKLTRQQAKQITRAQLLGAAAEIFAKKGYELASLEEIAAEAGFTQGAIYSNFLGKADLFLTAFEAFVAPRMASLIETLRRAPDAAAQVEALVALFVRRPEDDPNWILLENEFWLFAGRYPEHRARVGAMHDALWRAFARLAVGPLKARAEELGVSAAELASLAIGIVEGMSRQQIADPRTVDANLIRVPLRALLVG